MSTQSSKGGFEPFTQHTGTPAPLPTPNIDTDMIIPSKFLKTIKRTGLGISAFAEMRYDIETGDENPAFVLNQGDYRSSSILVVGDNFGCGSSREHAPWALHDFGVRCVISTSFADIFFNNCFKNGMLPIVVSKEHLETLLADATDVPSLEAKEMTIDLNAQIINRVDDRGTISFEVDPFRKQCLLDGLDDIALTLKQESKIKEFEDARKKSMPWI